MNTPASWVALALAAGLGALLAAWRFLEGARRDRIFARTPLMRIRSAAQGYVHVRGRAESPPDGRMTAPLSGSPCVWWDYDIARRETDSRGRTYWSVIERASSVAPFRLCDEDGVCLVGPVGAEVTPSARDVWYGDLARPSGTRPRPPPLGWRIGAEADYRYTERLIGEGVWLSVLGELRSASAVAAVDEQVRSLLSRWKADQRALLQRFDRDHDGRIDAEEWEAARAAARAEVSVAGSLDRISVIAQSTHGEPFVVSPLDERQLVRREKFITAAAFAASLLLVALALWALGKSRAPLQATPSSYICGAQAEHQPPDLTCRPGKS